MTNPQFADILATVPHHVGEIPDNCVTIILINEGVIVANMVFMMPERDLSPTDAMVLIQNLSQVDFEYFVTVAYSNRESKCEEHPAYYHESQMFGTLMMLIAGKRPLGAGLVTSEHWIDFTDDDLTKHPLSEIAESPTALHLAVEHGHERGGMRLTVPEPDLATPAIKAAVSKFAEAYEDIEDFEDIAKLPHYHRARAVWERCLSRDFGPTKPEAVDLIGYMQIEGLRDRLVVDVHSQTTDEQIFVQILKGDFDLHISKSRTQNAISLLLNLCQYTKGKQRVPILMALCHLSYHAGNNMNALDFLAQVPEKHRGVEWESIHHHLEHGGLSKFALNKPQP